MTISADNIAALLNRGQLPGVQDMERGRAAVAMILRQGRNGLELLYILRAAHDHDPWSGNIAFPGGRAKPDEALKAAAERETREEIGLDLASARYLGELPEVTGTYLPVRVGCFVYWIEKLAGSFELNHEVADVFWAEAAEVISASNQIIATVNFDGKSFETPAIRLSWPGAPVLWGLTYRLTRQFLEVCEI